MVQTEPVGVISIGSNDIHLLVASTDGIATFERRVNQSMLAELVGSVKGGVIPVKALSEALQDLDTLVSVGRKAGAATLIAIATEAMREVANGPDFINLVNSTLGIEAMLISGADHLLQFTADPKKLIMTRDDLHHALHLLCKKPSKEIVHDFNMPVERARLLPAGAIILTNVLARYSMEQALVKPNGIRGGLVVSFARYEGNWRKNLPLPPG